MKKFIVTEGYLEISPVKKKSSLSPDSDFVEAGEIIQGVHLGQIVFFESYQCLKTTNAVDGKEHYIVPVDAVYAYYAEEPKDDMPDVYDGWTPDEE